MPTRSIRCNGCNAPLSVEDPKASTVRCSFCGMDNVLDGPRPVEVVVRGVPVPVLPSRTLVMLLTPFALVVAIGGIVAALQAGRGVRPVEEPQVRLPVTMPAWPRQPAKTRLNVPMGPENLYWLDQYISPVPVDANGDGIEDIAGAFILNERNSLNAYVGVIDGKTWRILWKDGPFGDRKKATRSTGVAVKDGKMLAVNVLGDATIYDLASGKKLRTFTFDEQYPARWICGPDVGDAVYAGRGAGTVVDMKSATVKQGRVPAECEEDRRRPWDTGDVWRKRARSDDRTAPKLERFDATGWLYDSERGVVLGVPRGSDEAVLIGYDPNSRAETWRQPVAAVAPGAVGHRSKPLDLVQGRYFFSYDSGGENHVVAVEAGTGRRLWDAVSPGAEVQSVTVSPTRLYLVTLEWDPMPVNVLDIETGSLIARLGGLSSRY